MMPLLTKAASILRFGYPAFVFVTVVLHLRLMDAASRD